MEKESYHVCCVSIGEFKAIRELSKDEFDYHLAQIKALEKLELEDKLFALVSLNHDDLKDKISFYCSYKYDNKSFDFAETYLNLNRMVLNLLSSIRTYLDHNETKLKKKYGADSEEYQLFKRLTANAYDTSFAYRFLTKLRNFAQHCGLPSGSIEQVSSEEGETIRLILNREDLLKTYNGWGTKVKSDLVQQPEDFDMIPLIDKKISELYAINNEITQIQYQKITDEAYELFDLMIEVKKNGKGSPSLVKILADSTDEDSLKLVIKYFPYQAISRATGINIIVSPPHKNSD